MKLKVIALGKLKQPYFKEAEEDYVRRIQKFVPFQVIELKKVNELSLRSFLKESSKEKSLLIFLDEGGKEFSTLELARFIEENLGKYNLFFLLGGPFGFSSPFSSSCDLKLSLSRFTLNHQLARILLLEQIYRCFKIIRGEPYHH